MSDSLPVRVLVQDVWDEVALAVPAATRVDQLKRTALERARVPGDPAGYVLKFRGAEVADDVSLAEAGIVPNAGVIVLPRRRRPVR